MSLVAELAVSRSRPLVGSVVVIPSRCRQDWRRDHGWEVVCITVSCLLDFTPSRNNLARAGILTEWPPSAGLS